MAAPATFRPQTEAENELVMAKTQEFAQISSDRATTENHWNEVASLIDPANRNTFTYGTMNVPGEKKTDFQVDSTGMMALQRFSAILDSLLTPRNMFWHGLEGEFDYLNKDRASRLWFAEVRRIMFKYRYAPQANFASQNLLSWRNLGAYGNGILFIDEFDKKPGQFHMGPRYKSLGVGRVYFLENHQGLIDGCYRWLRLTARQAYQLWGETGRYPEMLNVALESGSQERFDFIQSVLPRDEYDPEHPGYKGMPYHSCYIHPASRTLIQEGGYRTFPIAASRYSQAQDEINGRGPGEDVLPALKTLNAEKRVFLKQGHRAGDPVLLTADDGIAGFSLRPGAQNKGGVTPDGKPRVHVLPAGDIQITEKMMMEEKSLINDAFLVTLFQILVETPQMSATEVLERTNEKGILLAPTAGRQQSEYLGPMIHRELDILASQGLLPEMPPLLAEARGAYSVVHTSPLARAMQAQEAAGFLRAVEDSRGIVEMTGDPSPLDIYDFDVAGPAIARIRGVPEDWMASNDKILEKRQNRAKQRAAEMQIQAAPAQAALEKAQAVKAKAGLEPGPGGQRLPGATR